eukprot:1159530-Pelagomonas_calceolata.AAC.6
MLTYAGTQVQATKSLKAKPCNSWDSPDLHAAPTRLVTAVSCERRWLSNRAGLPKGTRSLVFWPGEVTVSMHMFLGSRWVSDADSAFRKVHLFNPTE